MGWLDDVQQREADEFQSVDACECLECTRLRDRHHLLVLVARMREALQGLYYCVDHPNALPQFVQLHKEAAREALALYDAAIPPQETP